MNQSTSQKGFIAPLLLVIGLILCLVLIGFFSQNIKHAYEPVNPTVPIPDEVIVSADTDSPTANDIVCGIIVETPADNQSISSPLVIQGYVNGCGWQASSNGIAYVGLYSASGTPLTTEIPVSVLGGGTTTTTSFVTTLVYPDTTSSLSGYLLFRNADDSSRTYKRDVKY